MQEPQGSIYPPAYTPLSTPPEISPPPPPEQRQEISKALILGVVSLFVILLTAIGVLSMAVIQKNASTKTNDVAMTDDTVKTTKQVVATRMTKNENIEFLLYTPRQTANNTTIDFALKNTCETNCPVKSYATEPYSPSHAGVNLADTYLIDESAEEKYTLILDRRDIALISPQCYGNLKPGQKIDCFMSFAKVPSGSTVSLVMRDFRIDGISIP